MKRLLLLCLVLTGCAIQPKSACAVKVNGECRSMSSSEQAGAGSRGHTEEPRNNKMMFYVPPEEIWPDEYQSPPKVCASPFQGKLYSR